MVGKILVLGGDGSEIRPLVAERLKAAGYDVHERKTARGGSDTFFIELNGKPFDLVIIPNLENNFLNMVFEIVRVEQVRKVKVLAITERGAIVDKLACSLEVHARRNGVTAFLPQAGLRESGKLEALVDSLLNKHRPEKKRTDAGQSSPRASSQPLAHRGYWQPYEPPKRQRYDNPRARLTLLQA